MKKIKNRDLSIRLYRNNTLKRLRRKRKVALKKKNEQKFFIGKSKTARKAIKKHKVHYGGYEHIKAPDNFSIIQNPNKSVKFLKRLGDALSQRKRVMVKLQDVKEIDYGAVTALLSVMYQFKLDRIKFNGNFPLDEGVFNKLVDSQFFQKLDEANPGSGEYSIEADNTISAKANLVVDSDFIERVVIETTEKIWGEKRVSKGLFHVLTELMMNTHNHADKNKEGSEHWWLSKNGDNGKVSFVFVDYGQGIFTSLNNKPVDSKWYNAGEKIKKKFGVTTNATTLQKLLKGEIHKTVTGKYFRGKGLPGIAERLNKGQIDNLYIISNDAFGNVLDDTYQVLSHSFSGTFIYWELNEKSKNLPWSILN